VLVVAQELGQPRELARGRAQPRGPAPWLVGAAHADVEDQPVQPARRDVRRADQATRRHDVDLCIEPHGVYTKTAAGLRRIVELVPSPRIGVNWDTGNSFLAGFEDPYEALTSVTDLVRHERSLTFLQGLVA